MPYHKVGPDTYASPRGNTINGKQLRFWHAHGDAWPGEKSEGKMSYAKGGNIKTTAYAAGGPVLGRVRHFMKEQDDFRAVDNGNQKQGDEDNFYAKSGIGSGKGITGNAQTKRTGDKSLKAVKPRS